MRILRLLTVITIQVFILNQVHLFGYITPLFIGYMLICFSKETSRISLLFWGFVTGLLFDVFSNTAGMAAAACTVQAMVQPFVLRLFTPTSATDTFSPTIRTLGMWTYLAYAFFSMFVVHAIFYLLDAFTLHDWLLTLVSIFGSSVLASVLCVFAELLVRKLK